METIASRKNPYIKELYAVKRAGKKSPLCLIEGYKLICEAQKSGVTVKSVLISDMYCGEVPSFGAGAVRMIKVNDAIIDMLSSARAPQGIIALIEKKPAHDFGLLGHTRGTYIVLDGVADPGNVGTIIRSAEAFGAAGAVMCGACADVYNDKTLRATMGSAFRLPLYFADDTADAVRKLKNAGARVYAAALKKDARRLGDTDFPGFSAFVIGNEARGIPETVIGECDDAIIIPMSGETESLNAAVSASVILWEAARRANNGK
ncbi:MAG: RNA methyltransferase [Clostridia bacterium]|nr:RNA methyltransferase [Clostridia bacterium]